MKKIIALILAALLVMTLGVPAFAGETTPQYTDTTEVVINKHYKLVGEGTSPAETFTLAQIEEGKVKAGDAATAPALGEITPVVFAEGAAIPDGTQDTAIRIALPQYTTVGIYQYTLEEVKGNTAGVTYNEVPFVLVVTVINGEDGNIRVAAVHVETEDGDKIAEFDNTYSAGTLKVTKTVEGLLGDKSKYFEFTVTLTGQDGKTYADSFAVAGGSYESNPTKIALGTPTTFYLKHNETLSIANLPYGMTYTVTEADYTAEGYTTTKTGDAGTINAAAQTAAFTNTNGSTVDTGILLDNLPYVMILALVVMAAATMIIKRRRAEY